VNRLATATPSIERGTSTWSSMSAAVQPVAAISSKVAVLQARRPSSLTCVLR